MTEGETATSDKMTAWLEKARSLRGDFFRQEVRFFVHLFEGERDREMWVGQFSSFERLLESMLNGLVDVARYASFRAGLAHVDVAGAERIGVDGVIALSRLKGAGARSDLLLHMETKAGERGYPLSRREIDRQVQRVEPVVRPTATTAHALKENKILLELEALRRENSQLRRENEKLKAKLEKLAAQKSTRGARPS